MGYEPRLADHIRLRAERLEGGNGRAYTIKVTATDVSGNQNSKTVIVTVPKSTRRNCNLEVHSTPNPSHTYFTIMVRSNCDDKINLRIFNNRGDLISTINNITAPAVFKIGDKFRPGIYYLGANQSGVSKVIKLIKQ